MKNTIIKTKSKLVSAKDLIKTSIEIITNIATIISVIMVLFTLLEMQVQRNNAYRPYIVFESVQVDVAWGDTENIENAFAESDDSFNPGIITIPTRNIGVGVAKQITYSIDKSNFIAWLDLLNELDTENEYSYSQNGNQLIVKTNSSEIAFSGNYEMTKVFLLPNAEEIFDFVIPIHYTRLLQGIYSVRGAERVDIPDIEVFISFSDVQGVKYTRQIFLSINDIYIFEDSDGNGLASYKITIK